MDMDKRVESKGVSRGRSKKSDLKRFPDLHLSIILAWQSTFLLSSIVLAVLGHTNLADSNTTSQICKVLPRFFKVMRQESSLLCGKSMNDSKNAQDHALPETPTDDLGEVITIAVLPPEILEHIFTFIEPRPRKCVVALVCKHWKRLEATVPQHPTSILYDSWQLIAKSCETLEWLPKEEIETSRLEKATIICSPKLPKAKEECSGWLRILLMKLGAKPSPLTRLVISNFMSQPGSNLLDSLVRLRSLKALSIISWRYDSSEIPKLAELSNLQQLQDLSLQLLYPNSKLGDDPLSGCVPFRCALQSLTALTRLVLGHADIVCPVFNCTEIFCTQLRCLEYEPEEGLPEEGLANCVRNMPALSSLTIKSDLIEQYNLLPPLHHLKELVLSGKVLDPTVASKEAKLTSLTIDMTGQLDNLEHVLPLSTLSRLEHLRLATELADCIGRDGLPAFWSQLTNLTHLELPRCAFPPSSLAILPRLKSLVIHTCVGVDPLGPDNLLTLLQGLPSIVNFVVMYFVDGVDSDADIDEFTAEISRVQELLPDVSIHGCPMG